MRIFLLFTAWLLLTHNVFAEHEIDHRYQVHGYVLDAKEKPIAGRAVVVSDQGAVIARGKTDASGYYSLHLHLHNEDNRRVLQLRAGSAQADIRVSFDPHDLSTARVHDASFVAGKLVEADLGRWRISAWVYVLAGLGAIGTLLVVLEKRRKRKLRRQGAGLAGRPVAAEKRRKKNRRGKR